MSGASTWAPTTVRRWHCTGTCSGESPALPAPPTGRSSGVLLRHWQDGRVTGMWHFGDWSGWLTGAGVLPPLSAGA